MIYFCFRSKVYFMMPKLFPDTVAPISAALNADPKPTFAFRWHVRREECLETLRWDPRIRHDVEVLAENARIRPSLDEFARVTRCVGGTFCRRASAFSGLVIPSPPALSHRAMRVTLLYEFAVQELRLRETSEKRKMTRYDREEEDPEARRRRKYARDEPRNQSRDRRWDNRRTGRR